MVDFINIIRKHIGGFLCVSLLVVYIFLYHYQVDLLTIIFFVSSIFLGYYVVKDKYGDIYINNKEFLLIIFTFLYGIHNPIVNYVENGGMERHIYQSMLLYASVIPSFLLGILCLRNSKKIESQTSQKLDVRLLLLVLVGLILYKTYFFISIDMFFSLEGKNRYSVFQHITQMEVVINMVISGIFLYFIYYYTTISKNIRILITILLCYYIILNLGAGNRRDFIPMLLGIFWLYSEMKKTKMRYYHIIFIFICIFIFNLLGGIRGIFEGRVQMNDLLVNSASRNEFYHPFHTLSDEVKLYSQNPNEYPFLYGKSYIQHPLEMLIPRAYYLDKFQSLSRVYMLKFHNESEYAMAYTPVSEAFVNFGVCGVAVFFFIAGILVSYITNYGREEYNFLYFCTLIDFCRGEFFGMLFMFIFIGIAFWCNILMNRTKYGKQY